MKLQYNLVLWGIWMFFITGNADAESRITSIATITLGPTPPIDTTPVSKTVVQINPSSPVQTEGPFVKTSHAIKTYFSPTLASETLTFISELADSASNSSAEIVGTDSSVFDRTKLSTDSSVVNRSKLSIDSSSFDKPIMESSSNTMSSSIVLTVIKSADLSTHMSPQPNSIVSYLRTSLSEPSFPASVVFGTSMTKSSEISQYFLPSKIDSFSSMELFSTSFFGSLETSSDLSSFQASVYNENSNTYSFSVDDHRTTVLPSSSPSTNCTDNCSPKSAGGTKAKHVGSTTVAVVVVIIFVSIIGAIVCYKRRHGCGFFGLRTTRASYRRFRDEDNERVEINSML